jgi:hypothetical protein
MSTAREISRITSWANEITERRGRGEKIPHAELVEYQRAKVALLAAIAERDPSPKADETLAAARARLAELQRAADPDDVPGRPYMLGDVGPDDWSTGKPPSTDDRD